MPLLVGIDGRRKMSKSLGNQIGITDTPQEIYGKTMSVPDEAIGEYRRLLLDGGAASVEGRPGADGEAAGAARPALSGSSARDAKHELARELVQWLYSAEDADAAERHFQRVFVEHEMPEEIVEASFALDGGGVHLPGLMAAEFGMSSSQARRLIDEGGVTLGEAPLQRGEYDVPGERADGQVLKVGKRRFRRLRAA
jgi:tyrosyl-tRNA synthetase